MTTDNELTLHQYAMLGSLVRYAADRHRELRDKTIGAFIAECRQAGLTVQVTGANLSYNPKDAKQLMDIGRKHQIDIPNIKTAGMIADEKQQYKDEIEREARKNFKKTMRLLR